MCIANNSRACISNSDPVFETCHANIYLFPGMNQMPSYSHHDFNFDDVPNRKSVITFETPEGEEEGEEDLEKEVRTVSKRDIFTTL